MKISDEQLAEIDTTYTANREAKRQNSCLWFLCKCGEMHHWRGGPLYCYVAGDRDIPKETRAGGVH